MYVLYMYVQVSFAKIREASLGVRVRPCSSRKGSYFHAVAAVRMFVIDRTGSQWASTKYSNERRG